MNFAYIKRGKFAVEALRRMGAPSPALKPINDWLAGEEAELSKQSTTLSEPEAIPVETEMAPASEPEPEEEPETAVSGDEPKGSNAS